MGSSEDAVDTIRRIAALLGEYGLADWERAFLGFAAELQVDMEWALSQVGQVYGGMGSFSDIILQRPDGSMPTEDNDELERLRRRLYDLCMEARVRSSDWTQ